MNFIKSQLNRKVLYKYLISFILVFIVPSIFIMWFFNRYTSNMIIGKAEDELTAKFVRSFDEMEKRISTVKDLALRLSLDNETLSIANTSEVDPNILVNMSNYSKKLNEICVFNSYIKSVAMHIRSTDVVLSERGKSGFYIYFNQLKRTTGVTADEMKSLLKKRNYFSNVPLNDEQSKNPDLRITIVQSYPINYTDPLGSIILTLDKSILTQVIGSNDDKTHDNFIVLDANKSLLISKTNQILPEDKLDMLTGIEAPGIQDMLIDGRESIVLSKKSALNQLWYIYHIPKSEMTSNIIDFKRLMSIIVFVYILGGTCISLLLSILNYNPIKTLINEIVKKDMFKLPENKAPKTRNNEYDIIRRYISDLNNEKNVLNNKINTYLGEVKSNFLRELTMEGLDSDKFSKMSETLDLKFIYQYYGFVTFEWDLPDDTAPNDMNKTFFILDMIEEAAARFGTGHRFTLGKNLAGLILNIKDNISVSDIASIYRGLAEYIRTTYDRQMMIGISGVYSGYENIPLAYNEACDAVKYSVFYGLDIYSYDEMVKARYCKYKLSAETADKLANLVEAGDYDSSAALISQVLELNFNCNILSLNEVHKLYYELAVIMKKAADKYIIDMVNLLAVDGNNPLKNDSYKTLGEMQESISSLYSNACRLIRESRAKAVESSNSDIMNFIAQNYYDSNLSCSFVADRFNISQSYLSNIVKKYTGTSYSDHVNHLRLEAAKVLLLESESSINDIAFKLGYGSSNTFIRTFKSYEGVTPGHFKASSILTCRLKQDNHMQN